MDTEREPDAPRDEVLEGVGDPAEETTVVEPPPPVDPDLTDRMHRLREEISEDERRLQQESQQQ